MGKLRFSQILTKKNLWNSLPEIIDVKSDKSKRIFFNIQLEGKTHESFFSKFLTKKIPLQYKFFRRKASGEFFSKVKFFWELNFYFLKRIPWRILRFCVFVVFNEIGVTRFFLESNKFFLIWNGLGWGEVLQLNRE